MSTFVFVDPRPGASPSRHHPHRRMDHSGPCCASVLAGTKEPWMSLSISLRRSISSPAVFGVGSASHSSMTTDHAVILGMAWDGRVPPAVAATISFTSITKAACRSSALGSPSTTRPSLSSLKVGSVAKGRRLVAVCACTSRTFPHRSKRPAHLACSRRIVSARAVAKCSCAIRFASPRARAEACAVSSAASSAPRASASALSESARLCHAIIAAAPVPKALTIEIQSAAISMMGTLSGVAR